MKMPSERQVQVDLAEHPEGMVATVIISNPVRLNSMNSALMAEFVEELNALASREDLRAVIIAGAGDTAFIGGANIKEMAVLDGPDSARVFIQKVHACCNAVRNIPVPTIAKIDGFTFGAGVELAASCDLRITSEQSTFGMPEVKLGMPSVVEAVLLPMLVGWARTREMLLLGEPFSAKEAHAWGFVQRVVPKDQLDAAVEEVVAQLLTSKPRAVRLQKALINSWEENSVRSAIKSSVDVFADAFATDEPRAAMSAFFAAKAERKKRAEPAGH